MSASVSRLSGDDWQDWANRILSLHYGPTEYQPIADANRGDAGLEGYTRTTGHAYQAYGCEEPISHRERYDRQRRKMTTDIKKFIDNRELLASMFGTLKITRWALFVPFYDSKELLVHATKKTKEVKDATLPYVDESFQVCVCQQSEFAIADRQLIDCAIRQLSVDSEPPTQEQITEWHTTNEGPSRVLSEKLGRLPTLTTDEARRAFQDQVLDWFLRGNEILESLRVYPEVYKQVQNAKAHRERFLIADMVRGKVAQDLLVDSIEQLHMTLQREVVQLHDFASESLAYEAAADWLLRCPLDFPELPSG